MHSGLYCTLQNFLFERGKGKPLKYCGQILPVVYFGSSEQPWALRDPCDVCAGSPKVSSGHPIMAELDTAMREKFCRRSYLKEVSVCVRNIAFSSRSFYRIDDFSTDFRTTTMCYRSSWSINHQSWSSINCIFKTTRLLLVSNILEAEETTWTDTLTNYSFQFFRLGRYCDNQQEQLRKMQQEYKRQKLHFLRRS